MVRPIPGLHGHGGTDLPVLHSYRAMLRSPTASQFNHCVAAIPLPVVFFMVIVVLLWPVWAHAQGVEFGLAYAFQALVRWIPFLVIDGFLFTLIISFLTMALGTVTGLFLGLGQVARFWPVAMVSAAITQIFRNSPWLVLLFIVMLQFPFELEIGELIIPVPDWMKAVIGLSLPIMANISEIVRGAIRSVPSGQWEAAESLAFSRWQTLINIILPQCFKRMIPPWMNWYAILTMATPIVSILGVEEILNLARQAIEAENNRPILLVPFYGFVLLIFFVYCYPIARLTIWIERKVAVRL